MALVDSLDGLKLRYRNCFTDVSLKRAFVTSKDFCVIGAANTKPSFIIFGDSYTVGIAYAMNIAATKKGLIRNVPQHACP